MPHVPLKYLFYRYMKRFKTWQVYINTILPLVLYGCETWSLTLNVEHRLRAFENTVLRKIYGHEREKLTGEWGRMEKTAYWGAS